MQEHSRRGILHSSITIVAMHGELEREFRESGAECVRAAVDVLKGRATALPLPGKRTVLEVCSNTLQRRRAGIQEIFLSRARNIFDSLSHSGLTAPYRSLSDDFVQLQCQNASMEIRAKHSKLFWSKIDRIQKLVPLLKLRTWMYWAALVVLFVGGIEIADSVMNFIGRVAADVQDSGGS